MYWHFKQSRGIPLRCHHCDVITSHLGNEWRHTFHAYLFGMYNCPWIPDFPLLTEHLRNILTLKFFYIVLYCFIKTPNAGQELTATLLARIFIFYMPLSIMDHSAHVYVWMCLYCVIVSMKVKLNLRSLGGGTQRKKVKLKVTSHYVRRRGHIMFEISVM